MGTRVSTSREKSAKYHRDLEGIPLIPTGTVGIAVPQVFWHHSQTNTAGQSHVSLKVHKPSRLKSLLAIHKDPDAAFLSASGNGSCWFSCYSRLNVLLIMKPSLHPYTAP